MKPAILVENLSKQYRIGALRKGDYATLRESIANLVKSPFQHLARRFGNSNGHSTKDNELNSTFWALKDVSFEVQPGEVVGIIGRNGAGKSTLLKILTRITELSSGRIQLRGRIGSLLEVGTGFHPELTGRENIYLNGSILGMSRREIDNKFDEIVDFSSIEKFLDTPVKRYSSGMYVRLAFAVAAHLEPEILLVDEVLAVGDAEFQKKCLGKMKEISRTGRTVLFVSHNMGMIGHLCSHCIYLVNGQIAYNGKSNIAIEKYLEQASTDSLPSVNLSHHPNRPPHLPPFFQKLEMQVNGKISNLVPMGKGVLLRLNYSSRTALSNLRIGILIIDSIGQTIASIAPKYQDPNLLIGAPKNGIIECEIPCLNLLPGKYSITLKAIDGKGELDSIEGATSFDILESDVFGTGRIPLKSHGIVFYHSKWAFTPID